MANSVCHAPLMTLQTEILSIVILDFLKQIIILNILLSTSNFSTSSIIITSYLSRPTSDFQLFTSDSVRDEAARGGGGGGVDNSALLPFCQDYFHAQATRFMPVCFCVFRLRYK